MYGIITPAFAALALFAAALLPVGAANAAPANSPAALTVQGQAPSGPPLSGPLRSVRPAGTATPTDSSSPAGPADPGTGETRNEKETRVDYAPYVIGAVLVLALIAAWLLWRRRRNKSAA
jgi:LPXTG-motif cell wall-anchored protein